MLEISQNIVREAGGMANFIREAEGVANFLREVGGVPPVPPPACILNIYPSLLILLLY